MHSDATLVLRRPARAELEVKRSRFIALLSPADSPAAAHEAVAAAKSQFPDARHHCSAWIIRDPGAQPLTHSSDDGEPSGTAGRPMLDVLLGSGVSDVAVVVVRYFGGTLLGTGGLVRAYSDSVRAGLDAAFADGAVAREIRTPLWAMDVSIPDAGRLEATLRGANVEVVEVEWAERVTMTVAAADRDALAALASATLSQEVQLTPAGEHTQFVSP